MICHMFPNDLMKRQLWGRRCCLEYILSHEISNLFPCDIPTETKAENDTQTTTPTTRNSNINQPKQLNRLHKHVVLDLIWWPVGILAVIQTLGLCCISSCVSVAFVNACVTLDRSVHNGDGVGVVLWFDMYAWKDMEGFVTSDCALLILLS